MKTYFDSGTSVPQSISGIISFPHHLTLVCTCVPYITLLQTVFQTHLILFVVKLNKVLKNLTKVFEKFDS